MTLELTLLISLIGLVVLRAFSGPQGPVNTMVNFGPRLGARIEKSMVTGRCFQVAPNGASEPCTTMLWQSSVPE